MLVITDETDHENCFPIGTAHTQEDAMSLATEYAKDLIARRNERYPDNPFRPEHEFYFGVWEVGHVRYKKREDVRRPNKFALPMSNFTEEIPQDDPQG